MPVEGEYVPSPRERVREHVEMYERSDGAEGGTLQGVPVVILTSLGARTGKVRKVPLMRVERDGAYAVVASMGGAAKHPVWYYNLRANPQVRLQDGPHVWDMRAREVTGAEKQQWWDLAVETFPPYADYQARTDREIPVFVLERSGTH